MNTLSYINITVTKVWLINTEISNQVTFKSKIIIIEIFNKLMLKLKLLNIKISLILI